MTRKILWIAVAIVCLAGVLTGLSLLEPPVKAVPEGAVPLRRVSIVSVRPAAHAGTVSVFGQVTPRWQADLRARVSGRVSGAAPVALAGSRVARGDVLLRLEDAPHRANLADSRSALESARFDLKKKQNKHLIALKDWQAVNPDRPPPEMAVHVPEMRVTELTARAAEARLAAAEYDLNATLVRAPFPGIVTKRHVSPGASVTTGDVLFSILDDSQLELQVSVAPREWALLNRSWQRITADVLNEEGRKIGTARIREAGGFLDPQSRRYQLYLDVTGQADAGLVPGAFVRVLLPGRSQNDTLRIPDGALTQDGFVWYLDAANRLQRFAASPLFRSAGDVVISLPHDFSAPNGLRIIPMPMSSFLPGQLVAPMPQEADQ